MGKLDGKIAIVTGASKGIGVGIAKSLAAEGAAVAVNYASDKAGAEKTVAEITEAGGRAIAIQGQVGNCVAKKARGVRRKRKGSDPFSFDHRGSRRPTVARG